MQTKIQARPLDKNIQELLITKLFNVLYVRSIADFIPGSINIGAKL